MATSVQIKRSVYRRELTVSERGHDITGKYLSNIFAKKKRFNVTWRDMALKDLFRLISSNRSSFKCLVISASLVKEWSEHVESTEEKNQQMLTKGVEIVACTNLQRSEAYSFATTQEGYVFDVMIAALIYQGVPKGKAISMAYRNIEQRKPKHSLK